LSQNKRIAIRKNHLERERRKKEPPGKEDMRDFIEKCSPSKKEDRLITKGETTERRAGEIKADQGREPRRGNKGQMREELMIAFSSSEGLVPTAGKKGWQSPPLRERKVVRETGENEEGKCFAQGKRGPVQTGRKGGGSSRYLQ